MNLANLTAMSIAIDGRSLAAIIMSGFGAVWMLSGARVRKRLDWRMWLFVLAVSGTLCCFGVTQSQRTDGQAMETATSKETPVSDSTNRNFGIVLALEWPAIFAVVFFLRRFGLRDLILPVMALIVGVHFLPLAMIFHVPIYYYTAAAMIVLTGASFAIQSPGYRQAAVCASCGLALFVTSAVLLF